jgi:hypothetical protein
MRSSQARNMGHTRTFAFALISPLISAPESSLAE